MALAIPSTINSELNTMSTDPLVPMPTTAAGRIKAYSRIVQKSLNDADASLAAIDNPLIPFAMSRYALGVMIMVRLIYTSSNRPLTRQNHEIGLCARQDPARGCTSRPSSKPHSLGSACQRRQTGSSSYWNPMARSTTLAILEHPANRSIRAEDSVFSSTSFPHLALSLSCCKLPPHGASLVVAPRV